MSRRKCYWPTDWGLYSGIAAFSVALGTLEGIAFAYVHEIRDALSGGVAAGSDLPGWLLATEQVRVFAVVTALAAVALVCGRGGRQRFGVFLYSAGICKIVEYACTMQMLGWPDSADSTEALPAAALSISIPVWALLVVSAFIIVWGARLLRAPRKVGQQ